MIHKAHDSKFFTISLLFVHLCVSVSVLAQPPVNNVVDTAMIHNIRGANPFYQAKTDQLRFTFDILPFYQHSSGAKPGCGKSFMCCPSASSNTSEEAQANCCPPKCTPSCRHKKVPEGDRLGRWNMIGLLQGTKAAPGGEISTECQPTLSTANTIVSGFSFFDGAVAFDNKFTDSTESFGHFSVPVNYQKIGVRGRARLSLIGGFGLTARGGVARYKQVPCFIDKTCEAQAAKACPCDEDGQVQPTGVRFICSQIEDVQKFMMTPEKRDQIMSEICLDIDCYCRTAFEDTHLQLDWAGSFDMYDQSNESQVTVQPYFAVGGWIPTGEESNPDIAFSLPTTNNGLWGVTIEGGLNFSFPGTVIIGFGGGATLFESRIQKCQRVPSSLTQSTLYPWKATIKREPGTSWNAHVDLASLNFSDGLSFYFNYIYSKHESDKITLPCKNCSEPDAQGNTEQLFFPHKLEKESEWDSQMLHFALDYEITDQLFMGVSVQLPIAGRRIYKTSTIMGSIRFHF